MTSGLRCAGAAVDDRADARVDDQKIRAVRRRVHPDILLMRCGVATAAVEIEQLPGEQD